jgi:hypothetical protein
VGWRKWTAIAAALAVAMPLALCVIYRPDRAIRVGTIATLEALCARTFVAGLNPETVFEETLERPGIRRLRRGLRYQIDRAANTADVSMLGFFGSHAVHREGFGCVIQHGSREPYLLKADIEALKTPKTPSLLPEIADDAGVEPANPALKAALDHAFEEPPARRSGAPRPWSWSAAAGSSPSAMCLTSASTRSYPASP